MKSRRGQQISVSGELWHRPIKNETFPVDILVDTEADGGSYMSLEFYHIIDKWGRLVTFIRKDGKGTLNAANPPRATPHIMRILGAIFLPLKSPSEIGLEK